MQKKLTEEKLSDILEIGISEFAEHGLDRASMSAIAKKAGISVGVLYKYYKDKDAFFEACLQRSLDALTATLREIAAQGEERILPSAEAAIRAVQRYAAEHSSYTRMYLRITADSSGPYAERLADAIEGVSASIYAARIAKAQAAGDIRQDMNPRLFALFFDNLLMMLQFSYCCSYYQARFRRYCGEEILHEDELVAREMLKFLESAFTLEQSAIVHENKERGAVL